MSRLQELDKVRLDIKYTEKKNKAEAMLKSKDIFKDEEGQLELKSRV